MEKLTSFSLVLILANLSFGQYYDQNVTEQSFENSGLFFKKQSLNTLGVSKFKNVAVGLVDEPFLNLQLNPARLPKLGDKKTYTYLDFRGDRTESEVSEISYGSYGNDALYSYSLPYYNPKWYDVTREEPEPVFSLGILSYPFGDKLMIGGSYQVTYKNEDFYQVPSWIYYEKYGVDSFGNAAVDAEFNGPITDVSLGNDELTTKSHNFNGFLGFNLSERISLGASLNLLKHSREGNYLDVNNQPYDTYYDQESKYYNEESRDLDYNHFDLNTGLEYKFTDSFLGGISIGYLKGKAEQSHFDADSSLYKHNEENIDDEWSLSYNRRSQDQDWTHDGKSYYGGLNFEKKINDKQTLKGYYKFTNRNIDLENSSTIADTNYYSSRYYGSWDSTYYEYFSKSSTLDKRSGDGTRKEKLHELMLAMDFQVTEKSSVTAGFYVKQKNNEINSSEPVSANRSSIYQNYWSNNGQQENLSVSENKTLEWKYKVDYLSIQIPILFKFKFNENWSTTIGVNRILNAWEVEDETIAYFTNKTETQNGQTTTQTNFAERYKKPTQTITEDHTDVITKLDVKVSENFGIGLLVDPEFKDEFRIAQWWLSFTANF
ncbi:MAG: hypothetical protein DWQ06_00230 [Calditrichaeota bacterium]|nr:MAG: hypothetical protein DWQ06_00230 [Calditrichota bacterium]